MILFRVTPLWRGMLVLAILVGSTVSACGTKTHEADPTPSASAPLPTVTVPFELPITIAIAGRFGDQMLAVLDEQIATFEAANPDVKVEVIQTPRQREQLVTQLEKEGSTLDVYMLDDTWLAGLAAGNWLAPLDEYINAQNIEMDAFLPATVKASILNEQIIALPWTAGGGLLYYRKDLLDKHNYAPPTTWTDLQQIALDVKGKEAIPYGFVWQGAAYESLTCNTLEYVWAYGGDVLDKQGNSVFNSPQTQAALQQMSDLVASGTSPPEIVTYNETATLNTFQEGKSVFMRNWSYAWAILDADDSPLAGQVGIAPLPTSCLLGRHLALSTHSLHPEQALRFMAFLVSYDQQVDLAKNTGQPPALEIAYHDADLLTARPYFKDLYSALLVARPRPRVAAYPQVSEAIYTEINKMLAGEQGVEGTSAAIQRHIEAILHER